MPDVLVAVSLVPETGAVSAEHLPNVLARLNSSAAPEHVETDLKLSDPPKADGGRYDSLRADLADREDHQASAPASAAAARCGGRVEGAASARHFRSAPTARTLHSKRALPTSTVQLQA